MIVALSYRLHRILFPSKDFVVIEPEYARSFTSQPN
jgi:hypothetical protein